MTSSYVSRRKHTNSDLSGLENAFFKKSRVGQNHPKPDEHKRPWGMARHTLLWCYGNCLKGILWSIFNIDMNTYIDRKWNPMQNLFQKTFFSKCSSFYWPFL